MKTLHLLRHAKSDWGEPGLSDHDRPLNARGLRDAPLMGAALHHALQAISVHVSSARRAQMTLAGLCAGWPALASQRHSTEAALYAFDARELLAWLRARPDEDQALFLIAHNPGLTDLANQLVPGLRLANLPTAGYLQLRLPIEHWRAVVDCRAQLVQQIFPRDLQ